MDENAEIPEWLATEGTRVVLLDLDATLIDSEGARDSAWRTALDQLRGPLHGLTLDDCVAAYRGVYNCHDLIAGEVGPKGHVFEDLRQEWNARSSYALLIAWYESGHFPLEQPCDASFYTAELRHYLANHKEWILAKAEDISDTNSLKYTVPIDKAVGQFWSGDHWAKWLNEGVTDLLNQLSRKKIDYFVATEGHLPTQWRKICAVKLDQINADTGKPWIKPEHVLATSQAAKPAQELRALYRVIEWYRGRAAANRDAALVLEASSPNSPARPKLELAAAAAENIAKGLDDIASLFHRLERKLYEDERKHVHAEFYTRVLYALNQSPDRPAERLMQLDLSWDTGRQLRIAMVGDNFPNDVKPIIILSELIHKKLAAIWVKQGKHGTATINHPDGWKDKWSEAQNIQLAGVQLLDDAFWRDRTDPLDRPTPLFTSALRVPGPDTLLALTQSVTMLLVGVAAIRSAKHFPAEKVITLARAFVEKLFRHIVIDVATSPERDEVLERALVLSRNMLNAAIGPEYPGIPGTAIDFILSIATASSSDPKRIRRLDHCLELLANDFLRVDHHGDWAAAVITLLPRTELVTYIRTVPELRKLYIKKLDAIVKEGRLPPDFPTGLANVLHDSLQDLANGDTQKTQSGFGAQANDALLGLRCPVPDDQQSILLGTNEANQAVRCLLSGPSGRNIVCICGTVQTGKSNTLETLVRGSLSGEGVNGSPPKSTVVVFHHDLSGPSSMATNISSQGESQVKVLALGDDLSRADGYSALPDGAVRPLKFRLSVLPSDAILRWLELPENDPLGKKLTAILAGARPNLTALRNGIKNSSALSNDQKPNLLALVERLAPILAEEGEEALGEGLVPGELVVVDCARGMAETRRALVWDMALASLEDHFENRSKDRHLVLVFDEIFQVLSRHDDRNVKSLTKRLSILSPRMGRHQHVSIVAASQDPNDFAFAKDLWKEATALLFHRLSGPVKGAIPDGSLWREATKAFGLDGLRVGVAWYCSRDPEDAHAVLTGRVTVRPGVPV